MNDYRAFCEFFFLEGDRDVYDVRRFDWTFQTATFERSNHSAEFHKSLQRGNVRKTHTKYIEPKSPLTVGDEESNNNRSHNIEK